MNRLWESVLKNDNKEKAKKLNSFIEDKGNGWISICKFIEYPIESAFKEKKLTGHFRRVLIEIKILSITGKHCFHPYLNILSSSNL